MSDEEFEEHAAAIAARVLDAERRGDLAPHERFASTCRGSANPAALAWLAESLQLCAGRSVVDLGSGLGGPSAWFAARYGCRVVGLEPAGRPATASRALFGIPVVNASSTKVPFRADAFDAAVLLGVLSVVRDREAVLHEARRVAPRLGLLDYCSTSSRDVCAGGSRFPSTVFVERLVARCGWRVEQTSALAVDAPEAWRDAAERLSPPPLPSEAEVAVVIARGEIAPVVLIASR